jgi:CRISPR-associated protein Cmr4
MGSDTRLCEDWYGNTFNQRKIDEKGEEKPFIKEGAVKFEYASLLWLPVFCPGQPIVWVSCPRLLRRYAASARPDLQGEALERELPKPSTCNIKNSHQNKQEEVTLFFNLGFMKLKHADRLKDWFPSDFPGDPGAVHHLVVVKDAEIGMIHDMALYRQSRVKLDDNEKKVADGSFFNVEALPEGSILFFPVAVKPDHAQSWSPLGEDDKKEFYFGGLESIGFGRCLVKVMDPAQTQTTGRKEA